jgi:hypothetical protein
MCRVLLDEAEEFHHGHHCLGRSLQDSAHQLVQLLCHYSLLHRQLATEVHKQNEQAMGGRGLERAIKLS